MAFVQSKISAYGGGASVNITFDSPVQAGSLIIAIGSYNSSGTRTVSDGVNTYTRIATSVGSSQLLNVWFAPNVAAGATTVTLAAGVGVAGGVAILEYNNILASPADGTPGTGSFSASNSPSGAVTTTAAPSLVLGIFSEFNNDAISNPGNFKVRLGPVNNISVLEQFVTTTGLQTCAPVLSGSESGGICVSAYDRILDPIVKLYIPNPPHRPRLFAPGNSR